MNASVYLSPVLTKVIHVTLFSLEENNRTPPGTQRSNDKKLIGENRKKKLRGIKGKPGIKTNVRKLIVG